MLVGTRFQVLFHSPPGVLFTFPSQYYSLSVIGEYLGLEGGPPVFPPGFTCPAVLRILIGRCFISSTRLSLSMVGRPMPFDYESSVPCLSPYPGNITTPGLASSAFARHYLRNLGWFLFLALLRCFSSGGSPHIPIDSVYVDRVLLCRVSPFGYPRINVCFRLPVAFRRLLRPSSAPGAKASSLRSL